jgi:hypothetical protein
MKKGAIYRRLINQPMTRVQERWHSRSQAKYSDDLSFSEAVARFPIRNDLYNYFHHYYRHQAPKRIQIHREYFKKSMRGFGEDAFHAMWFTLFRERTPSKCVEIGVYRGQVISLWTLIAALLGYDCDVSGISPFSATGDAVSTYAAMDYFADTRASFDYFNLRQPHLVTAYSNDRVAIEYLNSKEWDLIYIDGGHDFDVVMSDYKNSVGALRRGGILVMDDSSLITDYVPPLFSSAGHPGPSRVVAEHAMKQLHFLGAVGHNSVFLKP